MRSRGAERPVGLYLRINWLSWPCWLDLCIEEAKISHTFVVTYKEAPQVSCLTPMLNHTGGLWSPSSSAPAEVKAQSSSLGVPAALQHPGAIHSTAHSQQKVPQLPGGWRWPWSSCEWAGAWKYCWGGLHPLPKSPGRAPLQPPRDKCLQPGFPNPPLSPRSTLNSPLMSQGNIPFYGAEVTLFL